MDSGESSIVGTAIQFSGTILVTILLTILLRTVRRPFLHYWAVGWCAMAVGLAGLLAAFALPAFHQIGFAAYCFGEYVGGYLWIAGCRALVGDYRLTPRDWFLCAPAGIVALALGFGFDHIDGVMAVHALFLACLFATSFAVLVAGRQQTHGAGVGVMMAALFVLAVDFLQYAPLCGYSHLVGRDDIFPHMKYSALYDLMLEMLLAFGMVMVVMEHVRQELVAANHELRAAGTHLRQLAQCDPLTDTLNRHAFDALMSEARASGRSLAGCVAMLDVDHLKPINDALGHAAGDRTLQLVADAARAVIRPKDLLFRWGGDEFLVIWVGSMREADAAGRLDLLNEEIAKSVRDLWDGCPAEPGVSYGLAIFDSTAELESAIHRADERMYARKRQRPNQIRRAVVAAS